MKKYLIASLLSVTILFFGAVNITHADPSSDPQAGGTVTTPPAGGTVTTNVSLQNPFSVCGSGNSSTCGVRELLQTIIDKILMPIAGVLIVISFIYTGFKFVMAQGNDTKLKEAKQMLKFTVIGTIIILGAAALTTLISGTIDQFNALK